MSLVLPPDLWPDSDRDLWADLFRTGGPFDDQGALSHLRAASRETLERGYGRWLGWLAASQPETLADLPARRATLPRLRAWLETLDHVAPMSRLMFTSALLRVLTAAAPGADWRPHLRGKAHLKRVAGCGDPARKQGRILCSAVLLAAGLALAGPQADAATRPLERARRQRNGAMIALLAAMPIRRRAFTALNLESSLRITDAALIIALPDALIKTGIPWEAEVPDPAASVLRTYLLDARPLLMARGGHAHDWLWVGDDGRPMSAAMVGIRIAQTTERLMGKRIPPHLFRDAAATTLARSSPGDAVLIRPLLGHSSDQTGARHYIQAGSIEAGRAYANLLKQKKGQSS